MADYQFFLSYSRRDAWEFGKTENTWFAQFRRDLIRDVAREAKLPTSVKAEDVGFYDQDGIQNGTRWSEVLVEGLQASKVFLALYSQNYFVSKYCGKEFRVFSDRVAQGGSQAGYVVPILWDPPSKFPSPLPKEIQALQFKHAAMGSLYADNGLMYLLRMKEETAYQQFLMAVSSQIAQAIAMKTLPRLAMVDPLDKIQSAFHEAPTQPPSNTPPAVKGVKAAWLVYVAGSAADYVNIRTDRKSYGNSGVEWQPFWPDTESLVGAVATNVVSSKNLVPGALNVSTNLVKDLLDAEANNTMAIVIVDPWSIQIKTFEDAMNSLDGARLTNCGVVIVWNKDPESAGKMEKLEGMLRRTFSRTWTSKDVYFNGRVETEEKLRDALGSAIDEIRRRISDRGRLLRGESPIDGEFPQLRVVSAPPGPRAAEAAGQ